MSSNITIPISPDDYLSTGQDAYHYAEVVPGFLYCSYAKAHKQWVRQHNSGGISFDSSLQINDWLNDNPAIPSDPDNWTDQHRMLFKLTWGGV